MKQKTLKLLLFLAIVFVIVALAQSCTKKDVGTETGPDDTTPVETGNMRLIPDSIFRAYLKANVCPNAFDKTGKLIDITNNEVKNFTGMMTIDTLTCPYPFVSSLKGVEYFTKMTKLVVKNSAVDSLSLSETMAIDTLRLLINKDLQYVDVSGCKNMRYLRASDIPVTSLDLSNLTALNYVNLITLKRLSNLNTTNASNLRHLMTYGLMSLKSVDLSSNSELRRLYLESSIALNKIDVTHNRKLYGLVSTYSGQLKTVDLSKNDSLLFVNFDDSNIDTIDFSHNSKLHSVAMLRTPLRNLDLRANPGLILLYLDGCGQLKTVDLRAQKTFDYYLIDRSKYNNIGDDDFFQIFQYGYSSPVPTAQHTIFGQATRAGVNGATANIFGGLRLPIFQDAGWSSLTNVKVNDAIKDNYSLVMSRRVLSSMSPALITVYGSDKSSVLCTDYSPELFKCN